MAGHGWKTSDVLADDKESSGKMFRLLHELEFTGNLAEMVIKNSDNDDFRLLSVIPLKSADPRQASSCVASEYCVKDQSVISGQGTLKNVCISVAGADTEPPGIGIFGGQHGTAESGGNRASHTLYYRSRLVPSLEPFHSKFGIRRENWGFSKMT